jgi:hypothetical protein
VFFKYSLMIFLTEKTVDKKKIEVIVYESLEDLSERVEWRDILDDSLIILDDQGRIFAWDDSQNNEVGTIYHYTFKVVGMDSELAEKCQTKFNEFEQVWEFEIAND